ncbi:MAG: hypothetical protein RBS05_18860 [Zoogloea oleivorans]|uniref:hypothetical protein n=1 Tax=Zoogloea oleivorans TaxID=1552750 RepID=UPI002A360657|nr:hypothetical protein [Zoogloea oleivorans]MDY0037977.1 hypothetical protein [Zoogloea oleivorans]
MDAWLAENAVDCKRYAARISPNTCKRYQLIDPINCKQCERLGNGDELTAAKPMSKAHRLRLIHDLKKGEENDMGKLGKCAECGKDRTLIGRGLCGTCYNRIKKSGDLDEFYPLEEAIFPEEKPVEYSQKTTEADMDLVKMSTEIMRTIYPSGIPVESIEQAMDVARMTERFVADLAEVMG